MINSLLRGIGIAALGSVLSLGCATAIADTYFRWVDERGNTVHSDRPPPAGVEYETITTSSSLVRKVNTPAPAPAETTASAAPPASTPQGADTQELEVIKRDPELCERARSNLASLESAARIRIRGDDGEMRFLDEEEKATHTARAQDMIDTYCE